MSEQYMEPVHPWTLNASELDRLRGRLRVAEAEAAKETDWVQRTRAEQNAKTLARELRSAEFATKQVLQQRQVGQQREPAHREVEASGRYIVSDDGRALLYARNTTPEPPRQEYMPIATNV